MRCGHEEPAPIGAIADDDLIDQVLYLTGVRTDNGYQSYVVGQTGLDKSVQSGGIG